MSRAARGNGVLGGHTPTRIVSSVSLKVHRWRADSQLDRQVHRVEAYLASVERDLRDNRRPVIFFNASTRIGHLSLNGAFGLLASWGLRSTQVPVIQMVCDAGLQQCMLGTKRGSLETPPPCDQCLHMSSRLYGPAGREDVLLDNEVVHRWSADVNDLGMNELAEWEADSIPAGRLCLPSMQWALRRSRLPDDSVTRSLFRQYILSSLSLASRVEEILGRLQPQALVVFNGITFPEAVARNVARRMGIRVITHEVGLRPLSAFFSHEDATFRAIHIPDSFHLSQEQERSLDEHLQARNLGEFTMAGVRFWPEMLPVPEAVKRAIRSYRQMVAVFTNVVFDTSQVHANSLFTDMFEWLDVILEAARKNPETLFVLRAHPDEDRPGKESQESVANWAERSGAVDLPNVLFFGPADSVSSYELIRLAKLTLVYNSSIGLEAAIAGACVLAAGRARYTELPTVFFPSDKEAYSQQLTSFLKAESLPVPASFRANARRFLYYELFRSSLDFSRYLQPYPGSHGFVTFRPFDPGKGLNDRVEEIKILREGILEGKPFEYPGT